MAWTAPATWSVSEVVTASKMNTHIRDNLNYLKGNAGAIAISAAMTVTAGASSEDTVAARSGNSAQYAAVSVGRTAGEAELAVAAGAGHFFNGTVAGDAVLRNNDATKKLFLGAGPNGSVEVATITASGMGVGVNAPQGKLHARGAAGIGNMLFYDYDGLVGAAQTILAAGSVSYYLSVFAVCRSSQPATQVSVGGANAPGGNIDITVGADVVRIAIAAGGGVTIVRNSGTNTHKVAILLIWL